MAKLVYDRTGRLLFTKEMKRDYTLLIPQMLPIHFGMFARCLQLSGYKCETLQTNHRGIVDTGLKYVHNDTCYPALLVIGQLIEAINSGRYDKDRVGLFITQTGGGCRASNYIYLLRKALEKAGLSQVPVVSINLSGLERNPGFSMSLKLIRQFCYSIMYGDLIMLLANQCRPYEVNPGETDMLVKAWEERLVSGFGSGEGLSYKSMSANCVKIVRDFAKIELSGKKKPRVGVVGEIYVKYSPLGNNGLEEFLLSEGAEPVVPGLTDFVIFKIYNRDIDIDLYGGSKLKAIIVRAFERYVEKCQKAMIAAVEECPKFRAPRPFSHIRELAASYLGAGNKMGEGWLLTGEMLELISEGTKNIVCTQPFGCLPNHIVGKGMIRRLKDDYPDSNIVAIDYDPGATRINQENRIKLMLANAARGDAVQASGESERITAAKADDDNKQPLPEGIARA